MAESEEFETQLLDKTPTNGKRKAVSTSGKDKCKTRKWSEDEVDELIDMLEERVCLWDVFSKEYHNRNKREKAFEEMEEQLQISTGEIKTKIAGLRAQLGRELAKTKATDVRFRRVLCKYRSQTPLRYHCTRNIALV